MGLCTGGRNPVLTAIHMCTPTEYVGDDADEVNAVCGADDVCVCVCVCV